MKCKTPTPCIYYHEIYEDETHKHLKKQACDYKELKELIKEISIEEIVTCEAYKTSDDALKIRSRIS